MKSYNTDLEKEKQKSESSKASIIVFFVSSIYLHYSSNWLVLVKFKTLFYFVIGIFGSGFLLGMFHYYLASCITYLLVNIFRNPTEFNNKMLSKTSLLLGIPFFIIGIIIDFKLTKLYFNWWY